MNKYFFPHETNISAAYIWINGGSSLDKYGQNGINQILCSLLTRGCKSYDNFEISNLLNFNGAELNYETLEDGIYIGIKSLNDYFENVYPLLEMLINDSNLPEREFIKCKDKQINYILKSNENFFIKAYDNWRKIVYKNHPYRYDSNGYLDTIKNIAYSDLIKEYDNFKTRNKYLLSNFEIENSIDISKWNSENSFINKSNNTFLNLHKGKRYIEHNVSTNQIIILLGNQTCVHNSRDSLTLKILESYLTFGMSSLLFKMFREKNGLTYESGIINPVRNDNAPFLIYLSVSNDKALAAFKVLINIWVSLLTKLIPKKNLELSKIKLKNSILVANQSIEEIVLRKVQLIGFQMDPSYDLESICHFKSISPEEVKRVVNKYLKNPFLSLLGDSKICNEIRKYWEDYS